MSLNFVVAAEMLIVAFNDPHLVHQPYPLIHSKYMAEAMPRQNRSIISAMPG